MLGLEILVTETRLKSNFFLKMMDNLLLVHAFPVRCENLFGRGEKV